MITKERMAEIMRVAKAPPAYVGLREYKAAVTDLLAHIDGLTGWVEHGRMGNMLLLPLREHRADALTAHVLHIIGPFLDEGRERDSRPDAARALFQSFYNSGVEIISDADRALAGLSPRGPSGMTKEELAALEARHMEALLRPTSSTFFGGTPTRAAPLPQEEHGT